MKECPQCGIEQNSDVECDICGFVFPEKEPMVPVRAKARRRLPVRLILIIALIAGAVSLYRYQQAPEPVSHGRAGKIHWETDVTQAMAEARVGNRPVMLFFTADWCGYCRDLIRDAFSDEEVVKATRRIVPILVDIDKHQSVGRDYGIRGVPTVIFLDGDGKRTGEYSGARDSSVYIDAISRLIPE